MSVELLMMIVAGAAAIYVVFSLGQANAIKAQRRREIAQHEFELAVMYEARKRRGRGGAK